MRARDFYADTARIQAVYAAKRKAVERANQKPEEPVSKRNLNPHKPARVAMLLWNKEYAAQPGGSMDFWDSLTEFDKRICREAVRDIENAPAE